MRRLISVALLLFVFSVAAVAGDSPAPSAASVSTNDHGDPVLKAMLAELKRSQEKLQLGQLQRPYYIDYQVTEIQDNTADATLGALRTDQVNTGRLVRVVVRIGDYKQDSYFGEGMGSAEVMPVDDEPLALRHQLWLATDKAYKAALNGLTDKQAALKNVVVETELPDFSHEKAGEWIRETRNMATDLSPWKQQLRSVSELFRREPELQFSDAMLHFMVLNRYFVNTEGTVARNGNAVYVLGFSGSTQAADGMRIDRSHAYAVASPSELPRPEELRKDALELVGTFEKLRN